MKSLYFSLMLLFAILFTGCADAGKDKVVESSSPVVLNGSLSTTEVGGKIEKYKWKQVFGKKVKLLNKNTINASFIAPVVKKDTKLIFELTTTEKGGYISPLKSSDTIEILVKPQTSNDTPPQAIIQTNNTKIKINDSITFDASSSSDSDGNIVSYSWTDNNGDILSSNQIFDYTFTSIGIHTITLTVTDDDGLSSSSTVDIEVIDYIKPIADFQVSATTILIGESISFDASLSRDEDGEIVSYLWTDQNSNILASEKTFSYVFNTQGEYTITLTVTDNDGQTSTKEVSITVQAVLNSIELTPNELSLTIGETENIVATGYYSDETSLDLSSNVTWTIADNTIASVDNAGTITSLKEGITTLKATIDTIQSNDVTIKVKKPLVLDSIKITPNPITLRVNNDKQISIQGIYSDGSIKPINGNFTYEIADTSIVSFDGVDTFTGLQIGETTLKIISGDITSALIPVKVVDKPATTNFNFTHFGTKYIDQIPVNATKEFYSENLFSMITGNIYDESGNPLSNVTISIVYNEELGTVQTDLNGSYVLPVEGNKTIIVRYTKNGYTTIDRKLFAEASNWNIVDDVTMLRIDDKVTTIDLNDSTPQVHTSSIISDDRGSRSTTLVFNGVSSATVKSPDGSTRILDTIDVRATEFKTPESMPANLPKESAYTYCSDLTVDGVSDDETVEFNSPVIMYVDNFLGFDVGVVVPVGYYDRNESVWKGSKNGVVVQLLDTNNDGTVDALDSTGDGQPNDLDNDGTFTSEVIGLEDNIVYQVGKTYSRMEINHFTPWDPNYPWVPDKNVERPKINDITTDKDKNKLNENCKKTFGKCSETCASVNISSFVETTTGAFHDDIPISGTNLTLHYSSKRTKGYKYIIDLKDQLQPPSSVKKIILILDIFGKRQEKSFTLDEFSTNATFTWDGKDKLGNYVPGKVKAKLIVKYLYKAVYQKGLSRQGTINAWAKFGNEVTGILSRKEFILKSFKFFIIDSQYKANKENAISNGWTLSNYDKIFHFSLQKGDGTENNKSLIFNQKIEEIEYDFEAFSNNVSGYNRSWKSSLVSLSGGNTYVASQDYNNSKILKIDPLGEISHIAGNGISQDSGDGGLALNASFSDISDIKVNEKGEIFIVDRYANKIKKIDENGIVRTIVGTGTYGYSGDNGLAINAEISHPSVVEIDNDGSLYFIDSNNYVIRKVDSDGIISTIVGTGESGYSGDGGSATEAKIGFIRDIKLDSEGNLYLVDAINNVIRKVDTLNTISTVIGTGESGYSGDGGLAVNAKLNGPSNIDIDSKGNIFILDYGNKVIRKVNENGYIETYAGNAITGSIVNNSYALDTSIGYPNNLVLDYNEDLIVSSNDKLYRIYTSNFFTDNEIEDGIININSNNTAELFNLAGNHIETIDLFSKKVLKSFTHDENKRLISVKNQFDNEILIGRNENGIPTIITAPNGQKTYLNVDSNGNLLSVTYEDNTSHQFEYNNDSLLTKHTEPSGASSFNLYDDNGRIIKEIDVNNEEWFLQKNISDAFIEYALGKPEGDIKFYREIKLENDSLKQETVFPNGDSNSITVSSDNRLVNAIKNNINIQSKYKTDPETKKRVLDSVTTILPSSLSKVTSNSAVYETNENGLTTSKTQTITTNGKATTIKNDYENGINTITTPEGRIAKEEYDINTRLTTSSTSGTLTPTTYTYDNKGRVISQTTGTRTTSFTYNSRGNIDTITDERGKTTSYQYDILDRVTRVTHPNGAIEEYSYDVSGNMTRLITPISTNHDFTYDNIGQRTSMKSALNKQTLYEYNGNRKLTQITRPSGKTIVNNYVNDRLDSTTTPEATINYEYIFNNQIGTITKGSEKIEYGYDGNLLSLLTYNGVLNEGLSYTYNDDFLPISFTYAGITENYTYDNDGLVLTSGDYTLTRDAENAYVTKITDGNFVQNLSYDNYGELTKVADNSFSYEIISKDNSALILQKQETVNNTTKTYDYTYDDNARLIEVKKDGNIVETYSYDNNENRTSATVNGVTTSGYYTLDDQVEVYGDNTYTYDEDGYLSSKVTPNGTTTYSYSTLGELKEVKTPSKTITYKHNANNQRVAKLVNGVVVEKYLWADLTTLLAIYDGNDNLVQRFEYANSRMPISMTQGSNKYYLHYDQVGSLRAVSDSNHDIIKEIIYDSFGNILEDSNPDFKVPFGFAGGLYDSDTGLTRFGYRDYDSYTGKWTAKDPIDFSGGDTNLYGYVLGDPINGIDPEGLNAFVITRPMIIPRPITIPKMPINPIIQIGDIESGEGIDLSDTSTWPKPPVNGECKEGNPSKNKPKNRGEKSLYDDTNGEWRPHLPDKYHPKGHWDNKPGGNNGKSKWENIYLNNLNMGWI